MRKITIIYEGDFIDGKTYYALRKQFEKVQSYGFELTLKNFKIDYTKNKNKQ